MEHDELKEKLARAFGPSLRAAIIAEYINLYRYVITIYDPDQGWDSQAFGFMAYKAAVHRLAVLARDPDSSFNLRSTFPSFRWEAGDFLVATYRVGASARDPIDRSFPKNENGAVELADLNQFSMDLGQEGAIAPAVIVAHQGNHITGLEAVYLAVPGDTDGRHVTSWHYTELLWRRSDGDEVTPPARSAGPTPASIPEVMVKLRLVKPEPEDTEERAE
jgi:hypothetical protein